MSRTDNLAHPSGIDSLPEHFGCGCCGRENREETVFCAECEQHLAPDTRKPQHERTWFAQYRTDCPFDENVRGRQA